MAAPLGGRLEWLPVRASDSVALLLAMPGVFIVANLAVGFAFSTIALKRYRQTLD